MQRTFNYTQRRKIEKKEAQFSFEKDSLDSPVFNAHFSLDTTLYPSEAVIYVEAYYKETRQRFDYGSVANIQPPKSRVLDKLDLTGPIKFRVLIVDERESHGLLLASGDDFRADDSDDDDRSSILPVRKRDLGQLTWKVEFETGSMPELCVNNAIPDVIEKVKSDPVFQSLILPSALKQVLVYYLWNEEDEDNDNYQQWLSFAEMLADKKPSTVDVIELLTWVDEVVENFSSRFDLTDRLMHSMRGEGV